MTVKQQIDKMKKEGTANAFVVYANIGNNSDDLIVCTAEDADNAGCVIVDIYFVEQSTFYRTAVITAEVL